MRKISEPATTLCPSCGKETFSKMLSAPSFQLSGTGWYASDFKDKKSNKTPTDKSETKSAEVPTKPVPSTASAAE
jgi:predicted nucleic acid-binding Zn ribbon protein